MKRKLSVFVVLLVLLSLVCLPAYAANGDYVMDDVRAGEGGIVLIGAVVGLAAALIVCLIQKNKLKSVRKGTQASDYNVGGLDLTKRIDQFTHTTVTKRKIEKSSGGGNTAARSGGDGHGRSGRL